MWYFAFLFSTVCHEAAHAWAALRGGDKTAYHGGQVSLDPIPHIRREPFGMILMPWLSFFLNGGQFMMGWASAPYDPYWARQYPKRAAWMSLAGPAANFALAIVSGLTIRFGLSLGFFAYCSSKAMLNKSVTMLARAVRPRGIIAALVCPGHAKTELGGRGASVEPKDSIVGLRKVIAGLTLERSGSFTRYNGETIAW